MTLGPTESKPALVALAAMISLASAMAISVGWDWALAPPPAASARKASAASALRTDPARKLATMECSCFGMLRFRSLFAPGNADAIGAGQNGSLCQADKQAVLDHAGNSRKPLREPVGIIDEIKRGIQNPVPAIGDESVTVLAEPKARRARASGRRRRRLHRPPDRGEPERHHLDRQWKPPERS